MRRHRAIAPRRTTGEREAAGAGSRSGSRNGEQGPEMRGTPLGFESLARDSQHFLLRGIVQIDVALGRIDADYNRVMKRFERAAGLQGNDQRAATGDMAFELAPIAGEGKCPIAGLLEMPLHGAGRDSLELRRVESLLNLTGVGVRGRRFAEFGIPILHD